MILDLGDWETFSADYMEVIRFFPRLEADFRVRIIRGYGYIAGNYDIFCGRLILRVCDWHNFAAVYFRI